ncbi:hypothetical protein KIW84_062224 [Lathyrus oleraceus]|uniref:Uncharacterized protein n=1 Tax=Pisum sativum TaxID=3888 RepID=A0A9D4W6P4_PEA|nr:hypothetical protein KIW84_062224 [Pisum sativum]
MVLNISALNTDGSLISNQEILSTHVIDHFKNLFSSPVGNTIDYDLIKDIIPTLINQDTNQRLNEIPSDLEIKEVVFNLNKDGALRLDNFGAFFFHHFWHIIQYYVIMFLKQFGFNDTFTNWIWIILSSSKISISFTKEVLSRSLTNLVIQNKIKLILGPRGLEVPSHCLFADDVMIFYRVSPSIKELERSIKYFIWSGDLTKSKLVTMAWSKCGPPLVNLIQDQENTNQVDIPLDSIHDSKV